LINQGLDIVLIRPFIEIWGYPETAQIRAAAAIVGADLPSCENFEFLGAEVQVTALDALGGTPPLTEVKWPGTDWRSGAWTAHGDGNSTQVWSDGDIEMTHEYNVTARISDPYEFRVRFTPIIRINRHSPLGVEDWIDHWVTPLRDLTSMSTGRDEEITHLALYSDLHDPGKPEPRAQLFAVGITQTPYHSTKATVDDAAASINLARDELSPIDLIRKLRHQRQAGNPLLETYRPSMMGVDQHPRGRFLFAVQCLESLHGFENKDDNDQRQRKHNLSRFYFFDRLDTARKTSGSPITPKDWQFAKSSVGRRPTSGLDACLRDLIAALPSAGIDDELEKLTLVATLRTAADPGLPSLTAENAIRIVRNDLAHGTRNHPPRDIAQASELLHRIVRAHVLRSLGCGTVAQLAALRRPH
jgi:hypothetical protein